MVPVLLFKARIFIESFQVSQGCEVVSREINIFLYCWRAGITLCILSFPCLASATYSLYLLEHSTPYNSFKSFASLGSNKYHSSFSNTLFINSSDMNTAVLAVRVLR